MLKEKLYGLNLVEVKKYATGNKCCCKRLLIGQIWPNYNQHCGQWKF